MGHGESKGLLSRQVFTAETVWLQTSKCLPQTRLSTAPTLCAGCCHDFLFCRQWFRSSPGEILQQGPSRRVCEGQKHCLCPSPCSLPEVGSCLESLVPDFSNDSPWEWVTSTFHTAICHAFYLSSIVHGPWRVAGQRSDPTFSVMGGCSSKDQQSFALWETSRFQPFIDASRSFGRLLSNPISRDSHGLHRLRDSFAVCCSVYRQIPQVGTWVVLHSAMLP